MRLNRVRVSREPPAPPRFPPVPSVPPWLRPAPPPTSTDVVPYAQMTPAPERRAPIWARVIQREPYPPAPDHALATTAHRPSLVARVVAWVDRLRGDNAARAEAAIREANRAGVEMGRTVERAEIQAELRSRLESGQYDFRTGNDAVRDILAYLDQETQ